VTISSIPFSRVYLTGREELYMREALRTRQLSGDGPFTKRCHAWFAERFPKAEVLLTTSCTHATEMAALLLDIQPGDEVIVPSFTFSSSANPFVLRGAHIVFADIREDTFNIDETTLERFITPKTRAIVLVHYNGVGCAMESIMALAHATNIAVVEDNAHGLLGKYKGQTLGTFGTFGLQSFHETKNITCGEGGALIINDTQFVARAEILREKGTNRKSFLQGQVDKYTWVDMGSSYLPSDLLAAFLLAQLEEIDKIQAKRRAIWEFYAQQLAVWAQRSGVRLPIIPEECEQTYHIFSLILPSEAARLALQRSLKKHGITASSHYVPLHLSPMGQRFGAASCPVAEDLASRLLRLPLYAGLTEEEAEQVITLVQNTPLFAREI
jgi:dTDP-4-amino-4,6-dideoxygalactose transaminase